MKLFNRLCIFLLGFVMGIVGCVGGLAGGIYYAYTGLRVEDFTGVLTKEEIPILDEDSKNITQMSLQEIIEKVMVLNNVEEITIGNLETTFGLDLSSLNLPDEVKVWPISKLLKEGGFEEFSEYVTLGSLYDLVTETLGVDWLADNYADLFGEGGNLRNVTLAEFLKDDGYINVLAGLTVGDLIPSSLYDSIPDYIKTLIDAIGAVSLGDLLRAVIKGEGEVLDIILNTPEVYNLVLSDLFPDAVEPVRKLLEGIKLGDILRYENNALKFDSDALLKAISIYDILCLAGFFDYTPEQIIELIPEGELRDRLSAIIEKSLYEVVNESSLEAYVGDLTIGGFVDTILALAEVPNAIVDLPDPIPAIWNKIKPILIIDAIHGIQEGNFEFILDNALYQLTLNDLFADFLDEATPETVPDFIYGLLYILKNCSIGYFINDYASIPALFENYTLRDMVGSYFFEGEYVIDENGDRVYIYSLDENAKPIAKMSEPIGSMFLCFDDISLCDFIQLALCEAGICGHENESEHITLEALLDKYLYPVSIGDIFDGLLYDEKGEFIAPEAVKVVYEAIRENTIGDIVAVANGEEGYETLLENLYKICLNDLVGELMDFDNLPVFVKKIYDKIAYISVGEIVEDWETVLHSLYTLTVDDIIGEYVDKENLPDFALSLYDCVKTLSIQDVLDAIENKEYYKLYKGLYDIKITDFIGEESFANISELGRYLIETTLNPSIGFVLEFAFCMSGLCETEGVVDVEHTHLSVYDLLEESIFAADVSVVIDLAVDDELATDLANVINAAEGLTFGEVFYAVIYTFDQYAEGLVEKLNLEDRAVMNLWELFLEYFGDVTTHDFLGFIYENDDYALLHPMAFVIESVANLTFNEINEIINTEDWIKLVECAENYFGEFITSKYFDIFPELRPYINEEHIVSLGFLFGYYFDLLGDKVEDGIRDENGDIIPGIKTAFDVVYNAYKDITLRDICNDWKVLVDALNKFTMADLLAELLGFTLEDGIWVNDEATATSATLFNAIADTTPYDLVCDPDYTMVLYKFKIIDVANLVLDAIDPTREKYNKLPQAIREYLENVGQITFKEIADGTVEPKVFVDALGDLTIGDIVDVFAQIFDFEIPQNSLLEKAFAVKLIDLGNGKYHQIAEGFTVYDVIDGIFVELLGIDFNENYSIIAWFMENMKNVTFDDIIMILEYTNDVEFELFVKKLLNGLSVEVLIDTLCEVIDPYEKHPAQLDYISLWINIAPLEISDLLFDTEKIEQSCETGLKNTSIGEVIRLVLDLIDEEIYSSLPSVLQKFIANLCDSMFGFYNLIDSAVNGAPDNYSELLIKAFLKDVDINDFVEIFKDYLPAKMFELALYDKIGSILIADLIYDTDSAVEDLMNISVGDVIRSVATIADVDLNECCADKYVVVRKLLENCDGVTIKALVDLIENGEAMAIFKILLDNISYADIFNTVLDVLKEATVFDIDDETQPEDLVSLIKKIISNVEDNYIVDLLDDASTFPWRELLDFTVDELFRGTVGAFTTIDYRVYICPLYKALGALSIIEIIDDANCVVENLLDITVGDLLVWGMEMGNIEPDYSIALIDNLIMNLKGIQIRYFTVSPFNFLDLIRKVLDDITYREFIEGLCEIADVTMDNLPSEADILVGKLMDNVGDLYLSDLFNDPIGLDWYDALEDVSLGMVIDAIMSFFNTYVDSEYKAIEPLKSVWALQVRDLIEDFMGTIVTLTDVKISDLIESVFVLLGREKFIDHYVFFKKLIDNAELLTVDNLVQAITGTSLKNSAEIMTLNEFMQILLNGIVINDIYLTFEVLARYSLPVEVEESELFGQLKVVPVYGLIFEFEDTADKYLMDISLGDVIDIVLIYTNFNPWTELQTLLDNTDEITVELIIDVINKAVTIDELIKTLFDEVTLAVIFAAPAIYNNTPEYIKNSQLYGFVSAISINGMLYDTAMELRELGEESVGDIIDLILNVFGVADAAKQYVTIDKLINNAYGLTIDRLVQALTGKRISVEPSAVAPVVMSIDEFCEILFGDICLSDIYNDITKAIGSKLPEEIEQGSLYAKLEAITLYGLIFEFEDTADKYLMDISLGDVLDLVWACVEINPWAELQALIDNADEITVEMIVDVVNGNVAVEELVKTAFDGITLNVIFAVPSIYDNTPDYVKNSQLYGLITALSINGLLYDTVNELRDLSNESLGDILDLIINVFGIESDVKRFVAVGKLVANSHSLTVDQLVQAFTGNRIKFDSSAVAPIIMSIDEFMEILLGDINLSDLYNDITLVIGYGLVEEAEKGSLYGKLGVISVYGLIFEFEDTADKYLMDISLGDVLDVVWAYVEINPWAELQALIDNADEITVELIVDVVNGNVAVDELVKTAFDGITLNVIFAVPSIYYSTSDNVKNSQIYGLITALSINGLLYDTANELRKLGEESIGDISDLILNVLGVTDEAKQYITIDKLVNNAYSLTVDQFVQALTGKRISVEPSAVAPDIMSIDEFFGILFGDICLSEIYNDMTMAIGSELPENIEQSALCQKIKDIVVYDLVDDFSNVYDMYLSDISVGHFVDIILIYNTNTIWSNLQVLIDNTYDLTVELFVDLANGATTIQQACALALDGIDLTIITEIPALYNAMPDWLKTAPVYVKLASIKVYDLMFDAQAALEVVKTITVSDVLEIVVQNLLYGYRNEVALQKLMNNADAVTVYSLIAETQNIEANIRQLVKDITVGDITSIFDNNLQADLKNSELYSVVKSLVVENLIFDTVNECAKLALLSAGGLIELTFELLNLNVMNEFSTVNTVVSNLKGITVNEVSEAFTGYSLATNQGEPMMIDDFIYKTFKNVAVMDIVNDVLNAYGMPLNPIVTESSLYAKIEAIDVYGLLYSFDSVYENNLKDISAGDLVEIVLAFTANFTPWAELQEFIENLENVTLGLIIDTAQGTVTVHDFIAIAIDGISLKIFTEIPAFESVVPMWIGSSVVYDKLSSVEIYDIVYDRNAALNTISDITLGEIAELLVDNLISEWNSYELITKLIENTKNITIYELLKQHTAAEYRFMVKVTIADINIGDCVDFTALYVPEVNRYNDLINLVTDAELLGLLTSREYKAFIEELLGVTNTLETVFIAMKYDGLYNVYENAKTSYYAKLFDGITLYELFTNPTPSVILGNITFGQFVGPMFNWTAQNAEMTVWAGTGVTGKLFGRYSNITLLAIVNKTIGAVITNEYIQSAIIATGIGLVGGAYALYATNIDAVNAYLNKTVDELLTQFKLIDKKNNKNTKTGALVWFISDNFGSDSILALYQQISRGNFVALLSGVTIGEVYDLVDVFTNRAITKIVYKNPKISHIVESVIESMRGGDIGALVSASSMRTKFIIVFGNKTLAEVLGLYIKEGTTKWYITDKLVLPIQNLADRSFVDVVQLLVTLNIKGLIDGWTLGEAYDLYDSERNKLASNKFGAIIYKIINANETVDIMEIMRDIKFGNVSKITNVITLGDIKALLPANMVGQLAFIETILDNNANMTLEQLMHTDNLMNTLFGDMRLGEIMGYTTNYVCISTDSDHDHSTSTLGCMYQWKDNSGNDVNKISNQIANLKISDLMSGNSLDIGTLLGDLTIADLMNLKEVDGKWMKNDGSEADAIVSIIAPIKVSDLTSDPSTLMNQVKNLTIGELIGLHKGTDNKWYTSVALTDEADVIVATIADMTLGEIMSDSKAIMNKFNDMYIGTLMNYYSDDNNTWYTHKTDRTDAYKVSDRLTEILCGLKISELRSGFNFKQMMQDEKVLLGEIMGYTIEWTCSITDPTHVHDIATCSHVWKDASGNLLTESMLLEMADIYLYELMTPGFDFLGAIGDIYIGNIMGYYSDDNSVWYTSETERTENDKVDKLTNVLCGIQISDFDSSFSLASLLQGQGLMIGDLMGYSFNATENKWTNGDVEVGNFMMNKMFGAELDSFFDPSFNFGSIFSGAKLGEVMGYTWDATNSKWQQGTTEVTDKMTLKLLEIDMGALLDTQNPFDFTSVLGENLGDLLGFEYENGIWKDGEVEVSAIMQTLCGLNVNDLMSDGSLLNSTINDMTLGKVLGITTTDGLLGKLKDLKIGEMTETAVMDSVNSMTFGEILGITTNDGILGRLKDFEIGNINEQAVMDEVKEMTLGEILDIDSSETGILGALKDLKISEMNAEKLQAKINGLTVIDVFGAPLDGILALVPITTTINELPTKLAEAVQGASIQELETSGIKVIDDTQAEAFAKLFNMKKLDGKSDYTTDDVKAMELSVLITNIVNCVSGIVTP